MAETSKELRAIMMMQAEILGRLESLERALESSGDPMQDRLAAITGLARGMTYEDPRLDALHQLCEESDASEDSGINRAIDDFVGKMKDR